jgi:hypothetical protein
MCVVDNHVDKEGDEIGYKLFPQMLGAKNIHFAPIYPQEKLNDFASLV